EGRDFARTDTASSERVAIVSQDLADAYYGGHAVGQTIEVEGSGDISWPLRIVGVAGDTWQRGALQPKQPVLYVPLAQVPAQQMEIFRNLEPLRFALRGYGHPADWQAGVRQALTEVAPGQP